MNITPLIRAGRLDPILERDEHGTQMLVGWRRKPGSRKTGSWTLRKPQVWLNRAAIQRGDEQTPGVRIVLAERNRQRQVEKFDETRDDQYISGELGRAAQCYEREPAQRKLEEGIPESWPFPSWWWKPTSRVRDLAKAGALYLAESERLRRAGEAVKADDVEKQALGCCVAIDNVYKITPLTPGPDAVPDQLEATEE